MRMAIFVPYWCTHPRHEKRTAMWLRIGCKLDFHIASPTPLILMLRPRSGAQQWVARESYMLTPSVPVLEFSDAYGNLCQRLVAPHGAFSIHTSADVQTADSIDVAPGAPFDEVQNLPDGVLSYLLPSRYCESDRYFDMASGIVAIAARQQVAQHAIGQVLHLIERRAGSDIDAIGSLYIGRGMDRKRAVRRDQALAQVAIRVAELQHRYTRRQHIAFTRHPLLCTATRTQHQDQRRRTGDMKIELASDTQPHGGSLFMPGVGAPIRYKNCHSHYNGALRRILSTTSQRVRHRFLLRR